MSGHTYIFEEIEILVYGSGRHFEFGAKNWISPNRIDGDFFLMLIHTFLKLLTKYQLYIILFGVIPHFDCTISYRKNPWKINKHGINKLSKFGASDEWLQKWRQLRNKRTEFS